ncbi:MAG: hypothetical protein ACFB0B_06915 [Thermonemataceae bacterium]
MKNLFHLFTYVCFILVLLACKREDEEVTPESATNDQWQLDERFLFDSKTQYNTYLNVEENALYFIGTDLFSQLSIDGNEEKVEHASSWLPNQPNVRTPISADVFMSILDENVRFASTKNPVVLGADFSFNMERLDPLFDRFQFQHYRTGETAVINSKNECIVPYVINDEEGSNDFRLLKLNLSVQEELGFMYVDTLSTQIIELPELSNGVITLHTLNDTFYVVTSDAGTFKLEESGNLTQVTNERLYRILRIDEQVIGINNDKLFTSIDGITWTPRLSVESLFRSFTFVMVEGSTVGLAGDQIFLFTLMDDVLSFKELVNEGLEGNQITSVATLNGKVYVTSLSGVFVKPIEDFFTEKVTEEE